MGKTERKTWLADSACLLTALIWGSGFIASQMAIEAKLGPSVIMALRFGIATLVLLALCAKRLRGIRRADLLHGGIAGVILFCAFYLQIYGQARTTVSNSAFLTATNVVMVPFLVWAAGKKRPAGKTLLLALTTLVGIGLLTIDPRGAIHFGFGDSVILLCAFFFALHIFYLSRAVAGRDALVITLIQIATAALISVLVLLLFDRHTIARADFSRGLLPVLYLGLFSTCACYLMQTWAQKYAGATKSGILLSTEGLFGSLFSVLLGFEPLRWRLAAGGLVISLSVLLMELPAGRKRRPAKERVCREKIT